MVRDFEDSQQKYIQTETKRKKTKCLTGHLKDVGNAKWSSMHVMAAGQRKESKNGGGTKRLKR